MSSQILLTNNLFLPRTIEVQKTTWGRETDYHRCGRGSLVIMFKNSRSVCHEFEPQYPVDGMMHVKSVEDQSTAMAWCGSLE
ncbi:hypothetical protein TNCV_4236631 [Trichonephila clavipes]|nr:hypothetical protein TNCV_4236631 [Trichonephila clavipes]